MFEKIIAFFMSIITFFMQLFGISANGTTVLKDVGYGEAARQVVDIYLPSESNDPVGMIVFIHGGAWIGGDKSAYEDVCEYASNDLGLIAATVNYRYINDTVHCGEMLEDINDAVSKVKDVAEEKGFKIKAAAYGGHSAGGHLALMYSYTYTEKSAVPVAFCFDQSGPTNMADENFFAENNAMGHETVLELCSLLTGVTVTDDNLNDADVQAALYAVSPISYVTASTVPTIIAHGNTDDIVPYSNAVALDAALTLAGVEHDFITYENTGHNLDNDADAASEYNDTLYNYILKYLK